MDCFQRELESDRESASFHESLLASLDTIRLEDEQILFWKDTENVIRRPNEIVFEPYGSDKVVALLCDPSSSLLHS